VLRRFVGKVDSIVLPTPKLPVLPPLPTPKDIGAGTIAQSWLWKRLGQFAKSEDIIVAEAGTAQFGFIDAPLPGKTTYITQIYYGSIGYSVGSCLGAALAQREIQQADGMGRIMLVVGDGSLQLTAQEIGTMVKQNLKPIM
jgi:pyruvate decarboxylase